MDRCLPLKLAEETRTSAEFTLFQSLINWGKWRERKWTKNTHRGLKFTSVDGLCSDYSFSTRQASTASGSSIPSYPTSSRGNHYIYTLGNKSSKALFCTCSRAFVKSARLSKVSLQQARAHWDKIKSEKHSRIGTTRFLRLRSIALPCPTCSTMWRSFYRLRTSLSASVLDGLSFSVALLTVLGLGSKLLRMDPMDLLLYLLASQSLLRPRYFSMILWLHWRCRFWIVIRVYSEYVNR